MSHDATNWAISVVRGRQLKPAAKLVLWHLADRYHPDHGCFPAQDTLANDCEMSRSSLNNQLIILEKEGLIRRVRRQSRSTNRQMSTRYILGCEEEFAQEPCPKSGHGISNDNSESRVQNLDTEPCPKNAESRVQNLDTNPVREPVNNNPLTPASGGMGSDRLEGFDLFLSVWPRNWPGVDDAASKLRSLWRRAVDQHGPDAVLASARNYLAKMQATPTASKSSVGWFLQKRSGMLAKFIPADTPAVPLGPLELGNSPQHEFLKAARKAGMPDVALRRWAREDAFVVVPWGEIPGSAANKAIGVDGDIEDFKTAFQDLADQHRMVIWPMTFLRAQQNKQQQRRASA